MHGSVVEELSSLTGYFLISSPHLNDVNFSDTLTYVCEHNESGALGVVVNKPSSMTLEALFSRFDLDIKQPSLRTQPIYTGGPVQTDRGLVLHRPFGSWQSTLSFPSGIELTTSRDILQAISDSDEDLPILVSLGYAGWEAGQIEAEISQNFWLPIWADPNVIFEVPAHLRMKAALDLLGVDVSCLSRMSGRA